MINKKFSKILISFFILISFNTFAGDFKQYNIYLIPSEKAHNYISKFNQHLESTNLLNKYNTTPFIKDYPVHISLYLTSFQAKHITQIENKLDTLIKNIKPFNIRTTNFTASKNGFVMLDILVSHNIQKLSNKIIKSLSVYRDKNYPAPSWVKFFPKKQESFDKYGSPNAFSEFTPHISVLAAAVLGDEEQNNFEKDFSRIIKNIDLKPASFKIKAIGFGEVNEYGQVIKPLHIYKLNS